MSDAWTTVTILAYCFTPSVVTLAVLLFMGWRGIKAGREVRPDMDLPGLLLASATRWMPQERGEWGTAMRAELAQFQSGSARWRFAMSCLPAVMFPPPRDGMLQYLLARQSSACGALAIMLPPLGWPFMLLARAVFEVIGGSPYTQDSRWTHPATAIAIWDMVKLLTLGCFLAGLPLGLAGLWRGECRRWLSIMGILSTGFSIVWFLLLEVIS